MLLAAPAMGAQISNLAATHHDGQTFLTWTAAGVPGTIYRVYTSVSPIQTIEDLDVATLAAQLSDSTWCDRRLTSIIGSVYGYSVDSLTPPLVPNQGLCVLTPVEDNARYFAVTAQRPGRVEERVVVPGGNALVDPVVETMATPRPVYQRTLHFGPMSLEVYTLWTTDQETALFPAMANRVGCVYDCGIVRGATNGGLMVRMHARGWNFVALTGSGQPGEWLLTLDDYLPTPELNTYWFGYHERFQVESGVLNPVPASGTVEDYTLRRMVYTAEWARRTFPVDPSAVYAMGTSMGGIGAVMLAMRAPEMFAAVWAMVPKFDFSYTSDPNPTNLFNCPNGPLRVETDRLWGQIASDLPTPEGIGTYQSLNLGYFAGLREGTGVPPIIAFNGKNDGVVGWAEKIPFYQAMRDHHQGGIFFFDERDHMSVGAAWVPMEDPRYIYRYRTTRSFPALSNCSADQNPGDGCAANGDSVGTINGAVEWDPITTDNPSLWMATLRLRDLPTSWGTIAAPASVTVDVTPRRLQEFQVMPGDRFIYSLRQPDTGTLKLIALATADANGVLTIPAVWVPRAGIELRILHYAGKKTAAMIALLGGDMPDAGQPRLSISRNPLVGSGTISVAWPGEGDARVDLIGVTGRVERRLWKGSVSGSTQIRLDAAGLPAGVYFVSARQSGLVASERVVVLP